MAIVMPPPGARSSPFIYSILTYVVFDLPMGLILFVMDLRRPWWCVVPYLLVGYLCGLTLVSLIKENHHIPASWLTRVAALVPAVCAAGLGLLRHTVGGAHYEGDINDFLYWSPPGAMVICLLLTGGALIYLERRR